MPLPVDRVRMAAMTYTLDTNDAIIMEMPATSPHTVTTILAPNFSLSGVAKIAVRKKGKGEHLNIPGESAKFSQHVPLADTLGSFKTNHTSH